MVDTKGSPCRITGNSYRVSPIGNSLVCMRGWRGTMADLGPGGQVVRHATATRLSPVRFRLGPQQHTPTMYRWGVPIRVSSQVG